MVPKKVVLFSGFVFLLSCSVIGAAVFGEKARLLADALAQTESAVPAYPNAPSYPEQGIHAGVWNDGQAALWDLNFLDHFHYFGPEERARGYQPEQPIHFSHVTHVQKNKMECTYCHWSVTKSPYAAIPEVETCAGCHALMVQGQTDEQKAEIKKVQGFWERKEPIPWQKVYVMPNYLKFNHKRHIKAGVSCQSCHGQIPEMQVVERVSSMKMGWCVSCHRMQGASIDCATCHY